MLKLSQSRQCAYKVASKRIDDVAYTNVSLLNIDDLQTCVDAHAETYYTAKDVKQLLSYLYDRAVAQGNVQVNLAKYITLPENDEKETVPFTSEEQKRLWEDFNAGMTLAGYPLLMIYTGMMPGELLKITKDMIDWQTQTATGGGLKTAKRKKAPIVLPDIIIPVLAILCDTAGDKLCSFSRDKFYDAFSSYRDLRGFNPELRPYSCRHTAATALDALGVSPGVIQELMRHARFATTQHDIHKDLTAVLAEINNKLGESR